MGNYDSIKVLSSVEHIRKRPHMYISSDRPSYQMWTEIMDNAVDEAMNGYAKTIKCTIDYDRHYISVEDDGRGLPHNFNKDYNKYDVELIYTYLNAGGKFDQSNYDVAGGLHGAGSCVVNALSHNLYVKTWRSNVLIDANFKLGETVDIKKYEDNSRDYKFSGTFVEYTIDMDHDLFQDDLSDYKKEIEDKIHLLKTLMPTVKIWYNGEEIQPRDFREFIQLSNEPLLEESILIQTKMYDVALNWSKDVNKQTQVSYCNSIFTPNGGDHVNGIHNAIIEVLGGDSMYGVNLALSVKYPGVEYDSQAKLKAINKEMKSALTESFTSEFKSFLRKNPEIKDKIVELLKFKRNELNKRQNKSNVRRDRKSTFLTALGSEAFADCNTKDRSDAEMYIVEGNSAAGSAKQARDINTQAIMPIRGKILNAMTADVKSILNNKEIAAIFSNLDTGIYQDFNISRARYDKVVIFSDADEDGKNIASLLIALFIELAPEYVAQGHLYLALPPLYGTYVDNKFVPINDEEIKDEYLKKGYSITRYKGLGEMNPEQLRVSCMDKDTRKIVRVDMSSDCDTIVRNIMGSDSKYRRELLIKEGVLR